MTYQVPVKWFRTDHIAVYLKTQASDSFLVISEDFECVILVEKTKRIAIPISDISSVESEKGLRDRILTRMDGLVAAGDGLRWGRGTIYGVLLSSHTLNNGDSGNLVYVKEIGLAYTTAPFDPKVPYLEAEECDKLLLPY